MYIHAPTNTYPYLVSQLKRNNPQTSFPKEITPAVLASFGVYPVQSVAQPPYDPITHTVRELPPAQVNGQWTQQWEVYALDAATVAANQAAAAQALQDGIVAATQQRLDDFARTRNYDSILSACTYATSSVPKFAAEGQYAVNARDMTWATLYALMADVQAGNWAMPTSFDDVEPLLPVLEWPL